MLTHPLIVPTAFVEKTVHHQTVFLSLENTDHTAEGFLRFCSVPFIDTSAFQGHLLWLLLGYSKCEHQQV